LAAGIIAAIVIGAVVGVTVLLLSIPLDLSFRLGTGERPAVRFGLRWFFGLVKKDSARPENDAGRQKKRAAKAQGRKRGLHDLLGLAGWLPDVWPLLRGVLRRVRVEEVEVDLVIGLDDPADTALFVGSLRAPALLLPSSSSYAISIQPCFDDGVVFQGHARLVLRLRPILIVPPIARFGCSRSGRRLLGDLFLRRWRRKR